MPISRHRQIGYTADVVSSLTIDEFKTFFRFSRTSAQYLKEHISEICHRENLSGILSRQSTGGSEKIAIEDRLLVLLWYMASFDKYSAIVDRFGVSESTSSYAIRNLLKFIKEYLVNSIIVWPAADEMNEIKDLYFNLKGFPGVAGMIDATHIKVHRTVERGIDYYNRKNDYSVILQAVVREDMRFTHVFAGFPGKVHDARVLKESPLYTSRSRMCRDGHILGDSGYPNLPWLPTPFRDNGHLTDRQKKYNKIHSSIRSKVECAFGLLKGRFTRLQYIHQKDVRTIVNTILSACVLHNICLLNDEQFDFEQENEQIENLANTCIFDDNDQEVAAIKRLNIARHLP